MQTFPRNYLWYGRRAHAPPCTSLVPRPRPPGAFARSNGGIWERDYLVTGVRDAVGDPEMQPTGDAARLVSFPRNSINGEGSGNARLGKRFASDLALTRVIINPRRACAARVTVVVVSVCLSVCVCVC